MKGAEDPASDLPFTNPQSIKYSFQITNQPILLTPKNNQQLND